MKALSEILIVDPDPHARQLASSLLEGGGYVVSGATDAASGLRMLDRGQRPIVIAELLLPGSQDGLGLCRKLLSAPQPPLGVILWSFLAAAERALEAGAVAFLAKPFTRESLLATVARVGHRDGSLSSNALL